MSDDVLPTSLHTAVTTAPDDVLPAACGRAVRAALQGDGPLRLNHAAVAACVLLLAVVLITGVGVFAALVWLVLGLLGGLAIVVRTVPRLRHG
jgi:hypothetical protein